MMPGLLRQTAVITAVVGIVVLAISLGTATGAFTTTDVNRPADIRLGSGDATFVGLDVADEVSVACSERLVTVTNNFDHDVDVTVSIDEARDGDLFLPNGTPSSTVSFTLSPGASQAVHVTRVQGPIGDEVTFGVIANVENTDVTLERSVPKVPGNEDEEDGDDNYGGDGCGDGKDGEEAGEEASKDGEDDE